MSKETACRLLKNICPSHDHLNPNRKPTEEEFKRNCFWAHKGKKAYARSFYRDQLCVFYRPDLCGWCDFLGGTAWQKVPPK